VARLFDDTNTDFLEHAGAVLTGVPITLAAWFRTDTATASQDLVCLVDKGANSNFRLNLGGNAAGDPVRAVVNAGGTPSLAATSTGYTVNTWHHAAAVFSATNARAAYIDGGSKGTNSDSVVPSGIDTTAIGYLPALVSQAYLSGRIAEVAIWNVALSDAEVAALARGLAPLYVQPGALVGYWPLWGLHSPEIDLTVNNRQMTVDGAVAADHAPVAPFSRRRWGSYPLVEAAAGGAPRQAMYYARMRAAG
jgi:hypothetical protein